MTNSQGLGSDPTKDPSPSPPIDSRPDSGPASLGSEGVSVRGLGVNIRHRHREGKLSVTFNLRDEYVIAVEKIAKEENLEFKGVLIELLEEGLIRKKALPEWWRRREFK